MHPVVMALWPLDIISLGEQGLQRRIWILAPPGIADYNLAFLFQSVKLGRSILVTPTSVALLRKVSIVHRLTRRKSPVNTAIREIYIFRGTFVPYLWNTLIETHQPVS